MRGGSAAGWRAILAFTLLVGLLGGWLSAPNVARAASIVVTTLADTTADDGNCTLREAVVAANSNAPSGVALGECAAGSAIGQDAITFAAGLTGTITLAAASGQLTITSDVTIQGPGAGALTVSGDNATRVFYATSGSVTIEGLTIARGHADYGAGIFIVGTGVVTLDRVTLSGNVATLIGGAIAISGGASATVTNTTVSDNQADQVGGVAVEDELALANSTISGNTATTLAGGLRVTVGGSAALTNATVAGNVGPGAANSASAVVAARS